MGKTHLAISLAIAAAQNGRRVYYGTLADLITSLEEAQAASKLSHRLKTLTHPALLVVDEIGYLPITRNGARLFPAHGSSLRDRFHGPHLEQELRGVGGWSEETTLSQNPTPQAPLGAHRARGPSPRAHPSTRNATDA
ncbi:MAG: ATP-binding protein [Gemmatimonadota bacterium]